MDVELAQQPDGRPGDVLAQAAVAGLAFGRQIDVGVAADQPLGFEPDQELAGGIAVQGR